MTNPRYLQTFWSSSGPLGTLSSGVLLVVATSRLSYAVAVSLSVLWTWIVSAALCAVSEPLMPKRWESAARIVATVAVAYLFERGAAVYSPALVGECALYLALVPIVLLSGDLLRRYAGAAPGKAAAGAAADAGAIAALLVVMAIVREFLGYGVLSLPGPDGLVLLFDLSQVYPWTMPFVSSAPGGLVMLALAVALHKVLSSRAWGVAESRRST